MLSLSEVQCIVGCSPGMPTPGHGSDPPPRQGLAWSLWRHWRVSRPRLAASCGSRRPRQMWRGEEVGIGRTDPTRTTGVGVDLLETEVRW